MYYHLSFLFQTTNLPQDLQFFQTVYHFFHGIFNVSYESLKFQMLDRLFFDKFWSNNLGISRIYIAEKFSAIHSYMQLLLHFQTNFCIPKQISAFQKIVQWNDLALQLRCIKALFLFKSFCDWKNCIKLLLDKMFSISLPLRPVKRNKFCTCIFVVFTSRRF